MKTMRVALWCVLVFAAAAGAVRGQDRGLAVVGREVVGPDTAIGKQWAVFIAIDRYRNQLP
ncbi:MAG: hypothetical protein LBP76_07135, partial [Treponema sp.]|nr:hypothetical protein [Treponema sp.]